MNKFAGPGSALDDYRGPKYVYTFRTALKPEFLPAKLVWARDPMRWRADGLNLLSPFRRD
jgi:hypothetical protein